MVQLPNARQVADYLGKLVRREVEVSAVAKPTATKLPYGGNFHGGDRQPIAMCAADIAFAAYAGSALSLVPPDVAESNIRAGALDEAVAENFAEVLNVLTRVFVVPSGGRVTLTSAIFPPAVVPSSVEGADAARVKRADFDVEIDGYGRGRLALWGVT